MIDELLKGENLFWDWDGMAVIWGCDSFILWCGCYFGKLSEKEEKKNVSDEENDGKLRSKLRKKHLDQVSMNLEKVAMNDSGIESLECETIENEK